MTDQDPNETAQISGSDFAQMCDEMKQLRAELADERAKKSDALIAAVDDIERLTAERDAAISLGRHAMFCTHHTDAERIANTVGGNCPICNKAQIQRLTAERDALRAAQQTVALLREALEQCYLHLRHAKTCATKAIIWSPCDCGMPEAEKLAREALATSAQ